MSAASRSVVVTGASTGIGYASVEALVARGFHVFGSVRRGEDAERLAAAFGASVTPLRFDVTDAPAIAAAAEEVGEALGRSRLAGLVNNAGIAVPGPLLHLELDDFRRQIEINLTGQLAVTQAFAPLLGTDGSREGLPGRIVMMSSQSGKIGSPFLGAYAASKFGLEGLSQSLRRELMPFGIDVIVIGPGQVKTPIWDKAEAEDVARYANTPYAAPLERLKAMAVESGRNEGLPVERLGELVARVMTDPRPRVRYAVPSSRLQSWLAGVLPARALDRLMARRLGLTSVR